MTEVTIKIEVDDDYADPNDQTGLTEKGYEEVVRALTGSVASGIIDISQSVDDG